MTTAYPTLQQVVTICAHPPHATVAWHDNGVERVATGCRDCLPGLIAEAVNHADGGLLAVEPVRDEAAA